MLVAQNAKLAQSAARDANLAALASGAAAVVTGQQVGLFLGPLYTLYKAASAIVVARTLAAETGVPVVPVFWLQTEDHDLVEIAACEVAHGATTETIAVPVDAANRISIAHLTLPAAIDGSVAHLAELLGSGPDAVAHVERVRRHYREGARWSDAFAGLLGELFADEGLVVIEPRDPQLASIVAPIHERAITDAAAISTALLAQCAKLGKSTVHVRPGAPLSFVHPDGASGPRVRLDADFDRAAVCRMLAADPMACSTSALLRPIVQDTLLPTAAYVGGPAELAYFAQLPPLYQAFDRPMPLVLERAHVRLVDERSRRTLARVGLDASQLAGSEEDVLARLRPGSTTDVPQRLLAPFLAAYDEILASRKSASRESASRESASRKSASPTSPAPTSAAAMRALARTRTSVERSIRKLANKLERIAAYEDVELVDAVRRARAWVAPDGQLQERRLGLPCVAARMGDRAIVEKVLAAIAPFDPSMKELA